MFDRIIKFFIENYKINYALFIFLFAAGIYTYSKIPKEVNPTVEPSSIRVSGNYSGTSVDILNKMAVTPLEKQLKNVVGVKEIISTINPGKFSIVLELDPNEKKAQIKEDVKDAITLITPDLPSDMDEPIIKAVAHARSLMFVSILSSTLSKGQLVEEAKALKETLLDIPYVSDITIFGESDQYYEVAFDEEKIDAYNISKKALVNVIGELSYTFPLGMIDAKNNQYFLSTANGKKETEDLENTLLQINDQFLYLRDIATVSKRYSDSSTLASMNGESAITLAISQNPKGDAITISEAINQKLQELTTEDIIFDVKRDYSFAVKESLNVVFSNIIFGIVLIAMFTILLINARMALVIIMGIPTSFVMGAIYFYFTGYSINVQSLVGVLLAIGIIVDDAIVVSENIQQYLEKGYAPTEAAFLGTKEMAKPVFWASVTTLFSFIPLLMITGTMGEIIKLIPIAFSALVFASLIESFIFLPIHSSHILKQNAKALSWEKSKRTYVKVLKFLMGHQKKFLLIFVVSVPLLIVISVYHSKFHMFNRFDSNSITITFKGNKQMTLEETSAMIKMIEKDLLDQQEQFFIKNVSSTAGHRRTATGDTEMYPYVGNITVELYEKKPSNVFERVITPWLSIYYEAEGKIRPLSSQEVSKMVRGWLKKQRYKKRFQLEQIMVVERRMNAVKADIRIGLVSSDYQKSLQGINLLQEQINAIKGVKYAGNDIKFGIDELKFEINAYGESLGITEKQLGDYLSNLYLEKQIGTIYGKEESYEIKITSQYKSDIDYFQNLPIPIGENLVVPLHEICDIQTIQSLEKLVKDNGVTTFYLFANVDNDIITSSEVLKQIEPTIAELKEEGIKFIFRGEQKQKEALKMEMLLSIILAISLIFLSLLYLFNSIRETLLVISVIPFSMLGLYMGHFLMGNHITVPSLIGAIGLAGVIVNDGIIMMNSLKNAKDPEAFYLHAARRFRPIILTSLTTIIGLFTLIFFATGMAVSFQPMAITIGFGLLWGTILNLLYLPVMYSYIKKVRDQQANVKLTEN
ncbi:efflux RND transporter permease subunit [Sulfurovum mangrovi]|uniref:efflux RND transporter permease subunit n=1 Tax=Sulfurovum mangrovi TaxID=2893889 RepID=UPI001E6319E2|nr:efflux RND transporter permease subunit [Sulfurovum mangrovi]UFH59712.1 efflux RND transporter permease subunit [Sulfurovum mangrovi]UFH60858.1 efflux RND transporter permease subunit [Sulfurovum mangrovi]